MNGRGDVRQEKALAAGGAWDVVDTIYDSMGLVSQESRPYRSGDTIQWTTTTYDAPNRIISVQHPDGSTMQSFYNESSRPNVASISPGETTRIQDAWGRERWSREDSSGRTVEVVEPNPSGSGSVTTGGLVTTYAYNTLDDLVLVTQGSQTRSFKYDSLGRLSAQKSAEGNAKLNDAGVFVGSGTWSDVFTYDDRSNMISHTDARGVKTIFSYNGDPLNRLQSVSWDTTGFGDTANPILAAPTVTFQYRTKSSSTDLLDVEQVSGFTVAGVVTETYTFDTEGRMSSKTVTITNRASYPMVVNYNYDAIVRRV
jgi:YD repeat-containing protein